MMYLPEPKVAEQTEVSNPTVLQREDVLADLFRLEEVVGRVQDQVILAEPEHQIADLACELRVEVARGLVEKIDPSFLKEDAGDGSPLALTLTQFAEELVSQLLQTQEMDHALDISLGDALHLCVELKSLVHLESIGEPVNVGEVLEVGARHALARVRPIDFDATGVRFEHAGQVRKSVVFPAPFGPSTT